MELELLAKGSFLLAILGVVLIGWGLAVRPEQRGTRAALAALGLILLLGSYASWNWFAVWPRLRTASQEVPKLDWMYELQAEQLARDLMKDPKHSDPKRLNRYEARVYSQAGEDGILQEIFRRVGTTNRIFCEFGAADGRENNSALLLQQGWGGLWMDGDAELVAAAKARYPEHVRTGKLKVRQAFITAENVEQLFRDGGLPPVFDLLSIDIDRNDYYVWEKIVSFRPRVAVIEYNGIFPPGVDWVVPYDAKKWWDGTSRAGASLTALERLGRSKGYSLVGTNLGGINLFFVRSDLAEGKFAEPYTAEFHWEPQRPYLQFRRAGHPRNP
jgi:hypothetical protein